MKNNSPRDVYALWAPAQSIWSPWAKPVLFASLVPGQIARGSITVESTSPTYAELQQDWLTQIDVARSAIVVNLPGAEAVNIGLLLAEAGYQCVPIFNGAAGAGAVIPVEAIQEALVRGAQRLKNLNPMPGAPPAFLLDSRRIQGVIPPASSRFDNRWIIFPQDLPSGVFLQSRGIDKVILLQREGQMIQNDLVAVFSRWTKAGLAVFAQNPFSNEPATPLRTRPFSRLFGTFTLGLLLLSVAKRRSNVGGFGSFIPDSSYSGTGA